MGTTAGLVTVAEYERMQDPPGFRLELRHGEVIEVPPPKPRHVHVQSRIAGALRAAASTAWEVFPELPFRPQAEHEVWVADVGIIDAVRWRYADQANVYPLVPHNLSLKSCRHRTL